MFHIIIEKACLQGTKNNQIMTILSAETSNLIRTTLSIEDELNLLLNLIKTLSLKRYHNTFFVKYQTLQRAYSISEFVWAYCYNPCFANKLISKIEERVPDYKQYLSILARANKKINVDNVFLEWNDAATELEKDDAEYPIAHSAENSSIWDRNSIKVSAVDGDIWNGLVFDRDILENIDSIQIELETVNSKGMQWGRVYEWSGDDIAAGCRSLYENTDEDVEEGEDLFLFAPFKHPLILRGVGLECIVSIHLLDGSKIKEDDVKLIFGVCNTHFCDWLSNEKFKLELAYGDKYIIDIANEAIDHP